VPYKEQVKVGTIKTLGITDSDSNDKSCLHWGLLVPSLILSPHKNSQKEVLQFPCLADRKTGAEALGGLW
jgi:hypothetical protein